MTTSCFTICSLFKDGYPHTSTRLQPNCSGSPFPTSPGLTCCVVCTAHQLFWRDSPHYLQWSTCCSQLWLYLCHQLWPTWLCWTDPPCTVCWIERYCLGFTSWRNWHCQLDISEWQWHLCYCLVDMSLCSSCFITPPPTTATIQRWQHMQSQWRLDWFWQGCTCVLPRSLQQICISWSIKSTDCKTGSWHCLLSSFSMLCHWSFRS